MIIAFSQTWGITISATILQNELKKHLPPAFVAEFPQGVEIAYAAIPIIPTLEEPLRTEVRVAFASAMSVVWKVMTGLAGGGLLTVFLLKEIPMHTATDTKYGLDVDKKTEDQAEADVESGEKVSATSSTHAIGEEKSP